MVVLVSLAWVEQAVTIAAAEALDCLVLELRETLAGAVLAVPVVAVAVVAGLFWKVKAGLARV
jgi:hypothetical protein